MSGFKLYEISEELMTLEDMLYDDTVDQETVQDTLEMINMDFEDKADNYAKIIRTMDASIKALKDEEQRLSGRRKALEERQKWLKDTLEANMRYTGKMKFKTPLFSFSIQKNGGLEPLVITGELEDIPGPLPDPAAADSGYMKIRNSWKSSRLSGHIWSRAAKA